MSVVIQDSIWRSNLDPSLKPYAHAYARFAAHDGSNVRPSIERVAWMVGVTERPAREATARLRRLGVLVVVRAHAPRRPTLYWFDVSALPQRPALNTLQASLPLVTEPEFSTSINRRTQAVGSRVHRLSAAGDQSGTRQYVQKARPRPSGGTYLGTLEQRRAERAPPEASP
jgi:hypothetical protein